MSSTDKSNSSLHFNQSQVSNTNFRTKYALRPQQRKKNSLFLPASSSSDKWSFSQKSGLNFSSKLYGIIHNSKFVVHHGLHFLFFDLETFLFVLERTPTNWNWKSSFWNSYHSSIKKLKSNWSISKLISLIQTLWRDCVYTFEPKNPVTNNLFPETDVILESIPDPSAEKILQSMLRLSPEKN